MFCVTREHTSSISEPDGSDSGQSRATVNTDGAERRVVLDALLIEDSYVYSLTAEKYWANEGSIVVLTDE